MQPIKTMADLKHANERAGRTWFGAEEMRFFGTQIESALVVTKDGKTGFFLTSDKPPHGPRRFSVRRAYLDSADILTVGDFCTMTELKATKAMAHAIAEYEGNEALAGV